MEGTPKREYVILDSHVLSGLIEIVELTSDEEMIFLVLAEQLGDGESASGAIAAMRLATVVTDDKKARRVLSQHTLPIHAIGTPTLLRAWEA